MKLDERQLVVLVVDDILKQYIDTLKKHREISDGLYPAKTSYGRQINVVKCSKGIDYAERIRENLASVLFRDQRWSRKELISVFHDKNYDPKTVGDNWTYTINKHQIAVNVIDVLQSMGINAPDILSSLIGYTITRSKEELFDRKKWRGHINSENYGKVCINYGKPKDFDILFGTDQTNMIINLSEPYDIIKRHLAKKMNPYSSPTVNQLVANKALENFARGIYPDDYGSHIISASKIAPYQRTFADFRRNDYKYNFAPTPKTKNIYRNYIENGDNLSMSM